jgi:flavin reductase (DIM6/NTAB) family NADH-FMN oxidoreductase RutF
MHFTKADIKALGKLERLNLINSVSGIKSANLIGTCSAIGNTNLAVFSSVIHLGSNPPLLGFVLRPRGEVPRNTYENIITNGSYTINHIHSSFIQNAHYTSAKFDSEISEFETCKLTEEYLFDFKAPFVKESHLKLAMSFEEEIPIKANGTSLIIGQIQHIIVPEGACEENKHIDLELTDTVGVSGLNSYYALTKLAQFPYSRVNELPDFK